MLRRDEGSEVFRGLGCGDGLRFAHEGRTGMVMLRGREVQHAVLAGAPGISAIISGLNENSQKAKISVNVLAANSQDGVFE